MSWVGLGRDPTGLKYSLINDAPSSIYWWSAIGATKYTEGADTIPGPWPHVVTKVELYVFNEGTASTTATTKTSTTAMPTTTSTTMMQKTTTIYIYK